jgi:hypothetical protein
MNRIKLLVVSFLAFVALGGASTAFADPGGPNSEIITLDCGELGEIDVAVNGNGDWSPGHVVGTNQLLIPVALDISGTFTPVQGEPESFSEQTSRHAPPKELFDCTFHQEGSDEFGSFVVDGIVTAYMVP